MAILHRAELRPGKLELIAAWLPSQSWYSGPPAPDLVAVGSFRFDDPDGRVGVETHLVQAGDGPVYQVPLTYRGAPLADAEPFLVGEMEHSVLGHRWVYDACADPVYAATLAETILTGGRQADEIYTGDDNAEPQPASVEVTGSGEPGTMVPPVGFVATSDTDTRTVVDTGAVLLEVLRIPESADSDDVFTLTGMWSGQSDPALLAIARHLRE
ncbi:hypothetical protein [Rhodococcus sp. HNM0569]|uniref:CG0192-related protein n=1 Tax=Rhodococcus sp. HNM0569 TaxID=2716340 RepID=UPI001469ABD0|nr:hypothetical protein [Rhodococcus sp. HNM0569]NLU84943.1 hypothetical protein [Rhodococcus sp. HNM0569]